jgi:hypothetical protein
VGAFLPPAPKCVKPFLVVNTDPQSGLPFVDRKTGAITAAPSSFIGETLTLASACSGPACASFPTPPGAGQYLPMLLSETHTYCPSDAAPGCGGSADDFESSTRCCDGTTFDYPQCGVSGTSATWDQTNNPGGQGGDAQEGLQCLIHATSNGAGSSQDTINPNQANSGWMQIQPGTYTQGRLNITRETLISTSDSIITVPLFDASAWPPPTNQVKIVGFLQLFVRYVGPTPGVAPNGDVNATILNVIGCGNTLAVGSAVSGGGASPIPVHLIHN